MSSVPESTAREFHGESGEVSNAPAKTADSAADRQQRINRLVASLIRHDQTIEQRESLAERAVAARDRSAELRGKTTELHEASSALYRRLTTGAEQRAELRDAIQTEVRRLRAEALPPEKIVIAVKHILSSAVQDRGMREEPKELLQHDVFQWMLEAMYAA